MTADNAQWGTPRPLVTKIEEVIGSEFTLDPCANNRIAARAPRFYCPPYTDGDDCGCDGDGVDGLALSWSGGGDWSGGSVFMNPPYSRGQLEKWCRKAVEESKREMIVGLVPLDPTTVWWKNYVYQADVVLLPDRRLRFVGAPRADTKPHAIPIWRGWHHCPEGPIFQRLILTPEQAGR